MYNLVKKHSNCYLTLVNVHSIYTISTISHMMSIFFILLMFIFKMWNEWCVCMMYNKECLRINALNHIDNLCQDLENIWMYRQRHYWNCLVYWSSWRRIFWGQKWKDLVWIDELWDLKWKFWQKSYTQIKKLTLWPMTKSTPIGFADAKAIMFTALRK